MKQKIKILSYCCGWLLAFSFTAVAQTTANRWSVEGTLTNEKQEPLYEVAIELRGDGQNIFYAVSDTQGHFSFQNVSPGIYQIHIANATYKNYKRRVEVKDKNIVLAERLILEKQDPTQLDEVSVVSRKKNTIEVKPDMLVFNVENNPTSSGLNGLDLLRKSPGVTVDKDGNIILNGNAGVRVFIDSKPSYLSGDALKTWLSSIRAEDIVKIELIANPSAKYEAEGTGGIINFILKKGTAKTDGWNGTLSSDMAMVFQNNTYQGSYNLTMNYKKNKNSLGLSYGFSHGKSYSLLNANRTQDRYYRESMVGNYPYKSHQLRLRFDHDFNSKHALSLGMRMQFYTSESIFQSNSNIDSLTNRAFIETLRSDNTGTSTSPQFVPSLVYTYNDSTVGEFMLTSDVSILSSASNSLRYSAYYKDQAATQRSSPNAFLEQNFDQPYVVSATKLDWKKSWKALKLEAGTKYSYADATSTLRQSNVSPTTGDKQLDLNNSNPFNYQEHIIAVYVQGGYVYRKFSFLAGLRDEYTITKGTLKDIQTNAIISEIPRTYNGIFPTFSVSFSPNDKHRLSFQYARRLTRPSYGNLNPFAQQISELFYVKGNPYLFPEYSNKLTFSYLLMHTLNLSLGYTKTEGVLFSTFYQEGSKNIQTMENIGQSSTWNVSLSSPLYLKSVSWWNAYVNVNYSYLTNEGAINGKHLTISAHQLQAYVQSDFTLPKKISLGFSGWYVAPSVWQATVEHQGFGSLDIYAQKKLFKDKLIIKIYFNDVLFSANIRFKNHAAGVVWDDGLTRWASRRYGIHISYRFGAKLQEKKQNNLFQEEEDRLKGGQGMGIGGK